MPQVAFKSWGLVAFSLSATASQGGKYPKLPLNHEDLLLFRFLPQRLRAANTPSCLEIMGTCCFFAFCHSVTELQMPQVALKSWGLGAFDEFGDYVSERILLQDFKKTFY